MDSGLSNPMFWVLYHLLLTAPSAGSGAGGVAAQAADCGDQLRTSQGVPALGGTAGTNLERVGEPAVCEADGADRDRRSEYTARAVSSQLRPVRLVGYASRVNLYEYVAGALQKAGLPAAVRGGTQKQPILLSS